MNRRKASAAVLAAAAVVALAAGCAAGIGSTPARLAAERAAGGSSPSDGPTSSADDYPSQNYDPSTAASAPSLPSLPSEPPPAAAQALLPLLVPMPATATPWLEDRSGALAVDTFVHTFFKAGIYEKARADAAKWGVQGAARRAWYAPDGSGKFDVVLVKLATGGGAQAMYNSLIGGWQESTPAGTTFTDGAVHGTGEVVSTADALGNDQVKVIFVVGDTLAYVRDLTPEQPQKQPVLDLAAQEYGLLKK